MLLTKLLSVGIVAPLLTDSFTDTNATMLASHTPEVGGPWTSPATEKFTIVSNQAKAAAGGAMGVVNVGNADVVIECAFTLTGNGTTGIIARYASSTSYLLFGITQATGAKLSIVLFRNTGGSFTVLERCIHTDTYASGVVHTIRLTLNGSTIVGELPSKGMKITVTETQNQITTSHGIRAGDTNDIADTISIVPSSTLAPFTDDLPIWSSQLTRYASNPVIINSDTGNTGTTAADPVLHVINGTLYMFFEATNGSGIGQNWIGQSADGFTWTNFMQVSTGITHYAHPVIYEEDGTIHLYMQNAGNLIRHRSSPVADFPNWSAEETVFDSSAAPFSWSGMNEFEIFKHTDGNYYLFGVTNTDGQLRGLYASSLPTNWNSVGTQIPGNPLINVSNHNWLTAMVEVTRLISDGRLLFYFGVTRRGDSVKAMGVFEVVSLSTSGMWGYWLYDDFTFGLGAAAWESEWLHRMSSVQFNGQWITAYDANQGGSTWRIGIATKPL